MRCSIGFSVNFAWLEQVQNIQIRQAWRPHWSRPKIRQASNLVCPCFCMTWCIACEFRIIVYVLLLVVVRFVVTHRAGKAARGHHRVGICFCLQMGKNGSVRILLYPATPWQLGLFQHAQPFPGYRQSSTRPLILLQLNYCWLPHFASPSWETVFRFLSKCINQKIDKNEHYRPDLKLKKKTFFFLFFQFKWDFLVSLFSRNFKF